MAAGVPTATSVPLSWTAIIYTDDPGGYEVYYATTSGGPYTLFETTTDKSISGTTVTGLTPGTDYYFVLRTVTYAHSGNPKDVYSEFSSEVSTTTAIPGNDGDGNTMTFLK